jgi:Calmodulin-binding domain C0 of NMDA receptor NR1 subunit
MWTMYVTGGFMEDLDEKWIKQGNVQQCENDEKTPATLGLKNMAGIFILVAAAIVGGVGLIVIEIMYKRHQIRRQRRLELARHAADKWRTVVEVFEFNLFNKFNELFLALKVHSVVTRISLKMNNVLMGLNRGAIEF